jgi:mono/diheme cytochrome c family protein
MRFLRDALITVAILIAIVFVVTYARVKDGGLSAEDSPGRVETAIAHRLVNLSVPKNVGQQTNPHAVDASTWREAADHFEDHCAVCHGRDGRGSTDIGQDMYPKVPNLADPAAQRLSDGQLFFIIQNGVRWTGMPAWKGEHTADDTWKLVSFIRHLPSLTKQELDALPTDTDEEHHHHEHQAP